MKKLVMLLVIVSSLSGCSEDKFVGSGDSTSEFRNVEYFNGVSSEGTFYVTITKGDEQSVEIVADNNIIHRVRTDVINGKLKLHLADGSYNNIHLEAHITVLDLQEINNSGIGDMHIYNNNDVDFFKVSNSGSANIFLEGNSNNLDIRNEGSGTIYAYTMPTENCTINNEGSGEIEVACDSNLNVHIEGSGNVYYQGNPVINIQVEGSGSLINEN